jgi:predicted O-methyltransferase YrrM
MTDNLWTAVDRYIAAVMIPADPVLASALAASEKAGLPNIAVSPPQGRLLHILARAQRARKILEIGTLGGYSTIWLARALPDGGRLVTLEADPRHVDVARANFRTAQLDHVVDLRLGKALDTLPAIADEGLGPFDLVFIDADKESIVAYFEWSLRLTVHGSTIIVDNVVRDGAVIDPTTNDPMVKGVRRFNERLAAEPRVVATAIQTVGSKGYDGFTIAYVL